MAPRTKEQDEANHRELLSLIVSAEEHMATMASAAQKRKRESGDQGHPNTRVVPATDFEQTYLQGDENDSTNVEDFAAMLSQHNAGPGQVSDDQQLQQPAPQQQQQASGNGQNASDTATAALAQYHTMTVPQPTENSFMTQTSDGGERPSSSSFNAGGDSGMQQRSTTFSEFDPLGTPQQGHSAINGDPSSPGLDAITPGGSKPAVGSDEWHKVRRDNHKEGTFV